MDPMAHKSALQAILDYYPARHRFMPLLSTKDIIRLCQTSWTIRRAIMDNEWDINTKLERFIRYPYQFRSQLGRSDAFISGSFALQFFERIAYPESDLDILVQDSESLESLSEFITTVEGYKMTRDESPYKDAQSIYIRTVQTYMYQATRDDKIDGKKTGQSKVQFIVTHDIPLLTALRHFYTTALMNFITWNKAYSIFPRATFLSHETMPLKPVNDYFGELHRKYSKRGWKMRTQPLDCDMTTKRTDPFGRRTNRRIGDDDTWVLRLDMVGIEQPSKPDYVLEYCGFQVSAVTSPEVRAQVFKSPSLKYRYIYPVVGRSRLFWTELGKFLARNTYGQLMKMSQSKVDELLQNKKPPEITPFQLEFEQPEGWDYHDDFIPRLYDHLEAAGALGVL
ncbi:hypothetical protein F4804DRAFT_350322 [Jackrogersella minutella]|nr:hypothetical protein F4804DRAFT_350322 [Jackrogersella minutella]